MSRNTIRRVEVAAPVEDERLKKRIREMFSVLMHDNVKARIMQNDGTYIRVERSENEEELNSQEYFYDEAYKKLADKKARQERMRVNRQKGAAKKAKKTSAKRKSKA